MRSAISKFLPCLPDDAEEAPLVRRLVDVEGARRVAASSGLPT